VDRVFIGVKELDFNGQWRILPFQVVRLFKALSEKFDILVIYLHNLERFVIKLTRRTGSGF
jgi:hypothetical protein